MMATHDRSVLEFIKDDAQRRGMGLREYCRRFGIVYTSLRGSDFDLDAAGWEVALGESEIPDDGQERLERHMLGEWDDSAFTDHLASLRTRDAGSG